MTAVYVLNGAPTKSLDGRTPYEAAVPMKLGTTGSPE